MVDGPPDDLGGLKAQPLHDPPFSNQSPQHEPPFNPMGGNTLIVDAKETGAYPRPSAALQEAGPNDQVFVREGIYEDKIFVADRPILLIGAGRDRVQIFSRRGGPLYLQRVVGGRISGITFRYVGSDQNSALNIMDSTCTITACRATEGVLSGVVLYGPDCRPSFGGERGVPEPRVRNLFIRRGTTLPGQQ